ncbi:MAG: hypothetical protein AAF563_12285 [Pseudomonadota bacterium]
MTFVEAKNQAGQIVRFLKKFEEAEAVLDRASRAEAAAKKAERAAAKVDDTMAARKEALETVIADLEEHRRIAGAKAETARQAAREAEEESARLVTEHQEALTAEIARLNHSLEAACADHDEAIASMSRSRRQEEEALEEARNRRAAFIASLTGDE